MLTLVTVPKPFRGNVGDIQRNAIESWRALRPHAQVVLVGDEEGVEEAARAAGVEHAGGLARNDRGTPRLDSAFERAATVARWPLWCLVNADVVLLDDFLPAVERVASALDRFLVIGECRDLEVDAGARLSDPAVRLQLRMRALERGRLRGWAALDYFVFRKGLFDPVPPFLIGRACFDNWLVWRARERRCPVIDATRSIVAVHQSHDYSHVHGGLDEVYYGDEARYNEQLAGGREHIYSLHDASHRLYAKGRPVRYWGSTLRAREKARVVKARMDARIAMRRGQRDVVRLLGVLPEPTRTTTLLLDAVAEAEDVNVVALYAQQGPNADAAFAQPPRHLHFFPRSVRLRQIDRVVGRKYPISWTIAKSFYGLRPDCMLISGWSTFATQAAIAWCMARRVPYLLLVDEHAPSSRGKWRQAVVRAIVRRAAAILVTPSVSEDSVLGPDVRPEHIRVLADPIDAAVATVRDLARSERS